MYRNAIPVVTLRFIGCGRTFETVVEPVVRGAVAVGIHQHRFACFEVAVINPFEIEIEVAFAFYSRFRQGNHQAAAIEPCIKLTLYGFPFELILGGAFFQGEVPVGRVAFYDVVISLPAGGVVAIGV